MSARMDSQESAEEFISDFVDNKLDHIGGLDTKVVVAALALIHDDLDNIYKVLDRAFPVKVYTGPR